MNIFSALKWSFVSEAVVKLAQPLSYLILLTLLTPDDLGIYASALITMGLAQILFDAGLSKSIIQRQHDEIQACNVAFIINLFLGTLIAIFLYFFSKTIAATFFKDIRVENVLQVMTLYVLFGAASAIHIAILQKKMQFKKLFWVRFTTVGIPSFTSIFLAFYGLNYWAIIIGTIIGQFIQLILLWNFSTWRPSFSYSRLVAKEIIIFGAWSTISSLLTWFFRWGDSLIVGLYLSTYFLGLYNTGNQLATLVFTILFAPIIPVLYSHLSSIQKDKKAVEKISIVAIKILTIVSIPITFIFFIISDSIDLILINTQWNGVGTVIGIMSLTHGLSWIVGMNGEVYRAIGKPKYEAAVTSITVFLYLSVYIYSIQKGFETFLWSRFFLALFAIGLHLYVLSKALSLSLTPTLLHIIKISLISGAIVFLVEIAINSLFTNPFITLFLSGFLSFITILGIIYSIEKNSTIKQASSIIKSASK